MSLWLEWGQWLMDGINWYMLIYLFLYLFSIYFQKRISRMPASCTINATIIYTSIFIPYTLLYMYSIVHRIPLDCPKRNHRGRFLVAAEHQPFILPCTTTTTTATTPFYRPSTTLYNHLFLVSIISQLHRESLPSHYGRQRFSRRGDGDAGSRREGVCHAEYHPVSSKNLPETQCCHIWSRFCRSRVLIMATGSVSRPWCRRLVLLYGDGLQSLI